MSRLRSGDYKRALEEQRLGAAAERRDDEHASAPLEPVDHSELADEQVFKAQLRKRMFSAILALPAIYRAPVMLRDVQGMSTEEASAFLRVKDQTLKSRLHRGRLILRKQLSDFAGGLSLHRPIAA
jgi:RNA polymerase sigma-70 factor (ECF subfamily)